jgi:hypothetical protein
MLVPGLPDEPYVAIGLDEAPTSLKGYRILAIVTSHGIRYSDGLGTTRAMTNGSALPVLSNLIVSSPPHGRPEVNPGAVLPPFRRSSAILMVDLASLDIREVVKNLRTMEKCRELDPGEADALIAYALLLHEERYGSFAPEWQTAWEEARAFAWGRSRSDWDPARLREIRYPDDTERSIAARIRDVDEMEEKLRMAADGYRTRLLRDCGEDRLAALSEAGQWRTLKDMAFIVREAMIEGGDFHSIVCQVQDGKLSYSDIKVTSE